MDANPANVELVGLLDPDIDLGALLGRLGDAGVPGDAIAVLSPLPLSVQTRRSSNRFLPYLITIVAGICGIGVGVFFAAGTAALYPLMTGGKPIIAAPVVGIVSFETMMLLAVLATFLTMIARVRRALRHAVMRDPRIDDGIVAISLRLPREDRVLAAIRVILEEAGAKDVRVISLHPSVAEGRATAGQALAILACMFCAAMSGCSQDMQDQASYQPQEAPRLHSPPDSVPRQSRSAVVPIPKRIGQSPSDGERLYQINCLHCHGPDGSGDGPVAGYLKELPANLRSHRVQEKSDTDIYAIITQGKDMMPSFRGELSAEERWTVVGFVKSLHSAEF
ncbi:MAG: quinol:electron acceptor oxidoreductase subunit ActD [Nitrospiraceae bacterium]